MSRFLAIAATHLAATVAAETYPNVSDMNKYLLIGTGSNQNHKSVNVQNGDLGADIVVLSTEINDNVDFDLDDVFRFNAGSVWINTDQEWSGPGHITAGPDFLPGASRVGEGVSWTGDVAMTSADPMFDMSNVELYGQVGVVSEVNNAASSVSNSLYFSNGLGNGYDTSIIGSPDNGHEGKLMPNKGVTLVSLQALRDEIRGLEEWVTELVPEVALTPGNGLPSSQGSEDVDIWELNVDQYDVNGDGIAVIDIL
eukprot:scaffold36568_cov160-Amphora_coffeaeformis.AAC.1